MKLLKKFTLENSFSKKIKLVENYIPSIEGHYNEALLIVSQKKFCQSLFINTITIEFYEIDDYLFYYTQFSFNSNLQNMFQILEVC